MSKIAEKPTQGRPTQPRLGRTPSGTLRDVHPTPGKVASSRPPVPRRGIARTVSRRFGSRESCQSPRALTEVSIIEKCVGCEVVRGSIKTPGGFIYQDEFWTVTHSISSDGAPLRGMLILQPRRHCTHLAHLASQEIANLGLILRETCRALDQLFHPAKIYACSVGEGVKHVHFMIIPRKDGMPIGAELFKQVIEEHKWTCSFQEAADVAVRVHRILDSLLAQGG